MPEPAQLLLLRAALAASERDALVAYEQWRERQNVVELDGAAPRVLALLRERLGASDEPVARQIERVVRMSWLQTQKRLEVAADTVVALRAADVPVMLCKGLGVLQHIGWHTERRPLDTIELAVPRAQMPRAVAALREGDFGTPHLPPDPARSPLYAQLHAIPFRDRNGVELTLYWHLLRGSLHPDADRDFWAGAQPAELRGTHCQVARREDILLQMLTYVHPLRVERIIDWAPDAVLLARAGELDWRRVEHQARAHRMLPTVAQATRALAEIDPALVPRAVLRRLAASPRARLLPRPGESGRRAQLAVEWERRNVAPGGRIGPREIALALKELWALERAREVPMHAIWVLSGRRGPLRALRGRHTFKGLEQLSVPCEVGFMSGERGSAHLRGGFWGYADGDGSWTRGAEAAVAIALVPGTRARALRLELEAVPYIGPNHPRLCVDLHCDGRRIARWRYDGSAKQPELRRATLPPGRDEFQLRLVVRGRTSREISGTANDARPLGLALRKLTVQ